MYLALSDFGDEASFFDAPFRKCNRLGLDDTFIGAHMIIIRILKTMSFQ